MCAHQLSTKTKVINIKGDRYLQVLRNCRICRRQVTKTLTELKRA